MLLSSRIERWRFAKWAMGSFRLSEAVSGQAWIGERLKHAGQGARQIEFVPEFVSFAEEKIRNLDGVTIDLNVDAGKPTSIRGVRSRYLMELNVKKFGSQLHIEDIRAVRLTLDGVATAKLGPCIIENAWINYMLIQQSGDIEIRNSYVANLEFGENAIGSFMMRGGAVMSITCAPPGRPSPFNGSVYFDDRVYFPRKRSFWLTGPQPYRNVRHHLAKLENGTMVNRFHSLEQAVERSIENYGFNRILGWLYEITSDYGASAFRPISWLLFVCSCTFAAILLVDGAETPDVNTLVGWQVSLLGNNTSAQLMRAVTLTLQGVLNPLSFLGVKGLLTAKTTAMAAWLSVHGLVCVVLIALFVLAVRRRFKMS